MDPGLFEAFEKAAAALRHFAVRARERLEEGGLEIHLEGHLDGEAASVIMDPALALVAAWDGAPRISLAIEKLEYISSLGIGMLTMVSVAARKRGIAVSLWNPRPAVRSVLELLGIPQYLPVHVTSGSTPHR